MAEVATRAGIHRRDQHELRRKSHASRRARNGHLPVLEWLAHYFQRRSFELRQLIEKEDPVVRDADFAGIGKRTAAKQADVANSVMRIAEGSRRDERLFRVKQ